MGIGLRRLLAVASPRFAHAARFPPVAASAVATPPLLGSDNLTYALAPFATLADPLGPEGPRGERSALQGRCFLSAPLGAASGHFCSPSGWDYAQPLPTVGLARYRVLLAVLSAGGCAGGVELAGFHPKPTACYALVFWGSPEACNSTVHSYYS